MLILTPSQGEKVLLMLSGGPFENSLVMIGNIKLRIGLREKVSFKLWNYFSNNFDLNKSSQNEIEPALDFFSFQLQ